MTNQEAEALIATIRGFVEEGGSNGNRGGIRARDAATVEKLAAPAPASHAEALEVATPAGKVKLSADVLEAIYLQFRNRMIDDLRVDPIFLSLLAARPEIEVLIEPRRVELNTGTLRGRVARLMAQGWFKDTRATFAVRKELGRTGADPGGGGTLAGVLNDYVRDGFLVRDGDGYKLAEGVKVNERVLEAQ